MAFSGLPAVFPDRSATPGLEDIWSRTPYTPAQVSPESGEPGTLGNLARSVGSGFGLGAAGLVGAAELVTGGDYPLEDTLRSWSQELIAGTSPEWQAAAQENWVSKEEDEWLGSAWGNPRAWSGLPA